MKDVSVMTEEEYTRYGRRRMKAMIRMKELSEEWLKERDTPEEYTTVMADHLEMVTKETIGEVIKKIKKAEGEET